MTKTDIVKQFLQNLLTLKAQSVEMQMIWLAEIFDTIESLTAELDSLRKVYSVTNESWKKLAGENEQLKQQIKKQKEKCNDRQKDYETAVELLAEKHVEIECLRVQNRACKEVGKEAVEMLQDMVDVANKCGSAYLYRRDTEKVLKLIEALSTPAPDYHNPEDVKALRMAKKAIVKGKECLCCEVDWTQNEEDFMNDAIAALDTLEVGE